MVTTTSAGIVFTFLALILLTSFGCDRSPDAAHPSLAVDETPAHVQSPVDVERSPVVEIWKERDGSVPIRGKSLHFRMYSDRAVEFDYLVSRETIPPRRVDFSFRRNPPTTISEAEFTRINSAAERLLAKENVKREYAGPVGLSLDTSERITVLLNGNEDLRKTIVVNDSDYDVFNKKFAKVFPGELGELLREVRSFLDTRTEEITGCRRQVRLTGMNCPKVENGP